MKGQGLLAFGAASAGAAQAEFERRIFLEVGEREDVHAIVARVADQERGQVASLAFRQLAEFEGFAFRGPTAQQSVIAQVFAFERQVRAELVADGFSIVGPVAHGHVRTGLTLRFAESVGRVTALGALDASEALQKLFDGFGRPTDELLRREIVRSLLLGFVLGDGARRLATVGELPFDASDVVRGLTGADGARVIEQLLGVVELPLDDGIARLLARVPTL